MTERERILRIARDLSLPGDHFVVSGSGAMVMHGIDRTPGDIDLYVATSAWFDLLQDGGWEVAYTTPNDPMRRCDPPYLVKTMHGIEVNAFFAWRHRETGLKWIDTAYWIEHAEVIDGIRVVPLQALARWKWDARRNKDIDDLELIEEHLRETAR